MSFRLLPDVAVVRRRELEHPSDAALARATGSGALTRVTPGVFVATSAWQALTPIDRHALRVVEAADRARGRIVVSHHAAAAIWGIEVLGGWPPCVETTVGRSGGGRSTGVFRRHTLTAGDLQTVPWRGHEITTPAQTALDLARCLDFAAGVATVDAARWGRRPGGALTDATQLEEVRACGQARRGDARAQRALAFSTDLSDSVRESQSRVLLDQLGFPTPELQRPIVLAEGGTVRPDFWFPEFDHAGEFDGTGKYFDPAMLGGRSPRDALLAEKDRGDRLRRRVRRVSRWRTPDLDDPRRLYDILTQDGLPSTKPRPPRVLRLR
ncbi:MAG TPA: hypothetical protein DHW40_11855 [Microbacterium sp.]|nr:hypothetical protein [Microbacterium sp.]